MNTENIVRLIEEMVQTPVGRLVADGPHRASVLEKHGIDYCCGGRRALSDACRERGLSTTDVARELLWADAARQMIDTPCSTMDWNHAPLSELCDHIERTHHDYLRAQLPRISGLTQKVADAHGESDIRLVALRLVFERFRAELMEHTEKEEVILLPWIRTLEMDGVSVGGPAIGVDELIAEHDDAGEALRSMRELTDDFNPPDTACNTYRALIAALSELEADMHQHVHKENNILFPRALEERKRHESGNKAAV